MSTEARPVCESCGRPKAADFAAWWRVACVSTIPVAECAVDLGDDGDAEWDCAVATIARLRQFAARLLSQGNQLAAIVFNVSQPGFELDDRAREVMKEKVKQWDEARRP